MGKRITVLGGAGMMGRGIIKDLVSNLSIIDIDRIDVCDLDATRIAAFIDEVGDPRLRAEMINVAKPDSIEGAITGSDLCVNAVPTLAGHQMAIFETALRTGTPYVDLGGLGTFTIRQLAYDDRFRDAGVTAVLGVGADPGMSNVICRAVADQFDEVDKINLYWAAELVGPENPALVPPYSISTVLSEYAHPSIQFLDGQHVTCPPMEGREFIDLPEPWGRCEFMYSPHSEQITVPVAEGIRQKGIREFTWKLHLPHREHEAWVGLVKAGFGDFDTPVSVKGVNVTPLEVLEAVIRRNIDANRDRIPNQDSHEIHFAIGEGRKDGRPCKVRCEVVVTPNPLYDGYVDACTSMNASIAVQLILSDALKPGVWSPEEYFDPKTYLREAERRHFKVRIETTAADVNPGLGSGENT